MTTARRRGAKLGLLLTVSAAVLLLASVTAMGFRVAQYNRDNPTENADYKQAFTRQLTLPKGMGGRALSITDDKMPSGEPAVRVAYGERELFLPTRAPIVPNQANLDVYAEWLAVLIITPIRQGKLNYDPDTGEGLRCVIVNRRVPGGANPDTWGSVDVKRWVFDVVELLPDGDVRTRAMQFPAFVYNTNKTYVPAQREDPKTTIQGIRERSWEWQAALFAVPKAQISRYRYSNDAVQAMGWTLPGAGLGVAGLVVGVILLMCSRVESPRPAKSDSNASASAPANAIAG